MQVNAFAAMKAKEKVVPFTYDQGACRDEEIEVTITHCGICHSDLHLIDDDWGISQFPLVPGHEIIGTVSEMGSKVAGFSKGQRVGIGWQCAACLSCDSCRLGEENLCSASQPTATGHFGGFGERVRAQQRFVFPIPDSLPSEGAAPLLCGGITIYSPLHVGHIQPNHHVAVLGIGGLGHLALQFYNAFGCEVTALSSSQDKEHEAKKLGAHHFELTTKPDFFEKNRAKFDIILSTAPAKIPYDNYLSLLKAKGKFCLLGVAPEVSFKTMSLLSGNKVIFASGIGNTSTIREMLRFAALHNIMAQTELFDIRDVNKALEKLRQNRVHYRAVLKL